MIVAAQIVFSIVALFTGRHDTVAADGPAGTRQIVEAAQGEFIRRAIPTSLRLEHDDLVDPVVHHAQIDLALHARASRKNALGLAGSARGRGHSDSPATGGVEHDLSLDRGMNAPQVHRQLAIDEDPDIIVTREIERVLLARRIAEPVAHLAGEAEVVQGLRRPWLVGPVAAVHGRGLGARIGGGRRDHARYVVDREKEWVPGDQRRVGHAGICVAGAPGCAHGKTLHCAVIDVRRSVAVGARSVRTPANIGIGHPLLVVLPPVHKAAITVVVQKELRNVGGVGPLCVPVPLAETGRTGDVPGSRRGRRENRLAFAVERALNQAGHSQVAARDGGRVEIAAQKEVAVGDRHGHGGSGGIGLSALVAGLYRAGRRAAVAVVGVAIVAPFVDDQSVPALGNASARGRAAIRLRVAGG